MYNRVLNEAMDEIERVNLSKVSEAIELLNSKALKIILKSQKIITDACEMGRFFICAFSLYFQSRILTHLWCSAIGVINLKAILHQHARGVIIIEIVHFVTPLPIIALNVRVFKKFLPLSVRNKIFENMNGENSYAHLL